MNDFAVLFGEDIERTGFVGEEVSSERVDEVLDEFCFTGVL